MDGIKMDGKTTDGTMMATPTRWGGKVITSRMMTGLMQGDAICPTAARLSRTLTIPSTGDFSILRMTTTCAGLGGRMVALVRGRNVTREGSATQQEKIANQATAVN